MCRIASLFLLQRLKGVTEAERKHVRRRARFQQHRDANCQVFFFLQGKAPKEIHAIVTETLACFLPGRAKDLSAPCTTVWCMYLDSEEKEGVSAACVYGRAIRPRQFS